MDRNPAPEPDGTDVPELTPEQEEQARLMAAQLAEARAQILAADAADVVANHVMGLYELAAIHLTADKPDLAAARLAIDAVGALVDGLGARLGANRDTLVDALHQIRLAFVQRSAAASPPAASAESAESGVEG